MPLIILRFIFFLVAAGGAVSLVQAKSLPKEPLWLPWGIFLGVMFISAAVVAVDALLPKKPLDVISSVYFGLLVGLFLTYIARLALAPALPLNDFTRG
jgi:hypothetical protein